MEKICYSISEVTALTGIGRSTLYAHIGEQKLKVHRIGGRTVVLHSDLISFIKSNPSKPGHYR